MLTLNQLKELIHFGDDKTAEEWYAALVPAFVKYKIDTPFRMAAFLAQVTHESNDFKWLSENLNYSAASLNKVFHKYFPTLDSTTWYAHHPERIANRVYANRMGNGSERSGDGWKYRGKGLIQLTGKNNHAAFAASIGKSLDDTIAYLLTKEGAVESAAWFWTKHGLNGVADNRDTVRITKIINGGTNGLEDRQNRYNKAINIIT